MKKIISVLIIIMLFMLLINSSYASDSDIEVSLSSTTANLGDIITVTVSITEREDGIAGLQGKFVWDSEQLTYIDSKVESDFSTLNFNEDSTSEAFGTFSVYGDDYITSRAKVFSVQFKVNEDLTDVSEINIDIINIKAEYQEAGTIDIQDKNAKVLINRDNIKNEINENNTNSTINNETNIQGEINSIQGNKTDSTVAKTKLPAAGMEKAIAVAILGIVVLAIIFKIKSRKIKY